MKSKIKPNKHLNSIERFNADKVFRSGYLCLNMNENISALPAGFVKEVAAKLTSDYISKYPECKELVGNVAKLDKLDFDNICLSNGSDSAIKYIFETYISPNDKVLLTDPTFAMYPIYCKMYRAKPVFAGYKDSFNFPVRDFLNSLKKGVKMAVIINPNNPTGSVIDKHDLLKIVKKAHRSNILLIIDEAYHYFYGKSYIDLVKKYDNVVVLRTFSKLCGLAGCRLGYAAASRGIIHNIKKVKPTYDVNSISVVFANKLIKTKGLINKLIRDFNIGKKYLTDKLEAKGINYISGHANFVLIECDRNVNAVAKDLLKDKVLIGSKFSQPFLKDFIRVTTSSKNNMRKFWKYFIKAYTKHEKY
jgi:histidinol-phosphate aminotransferase